MADDLSGFGSLAQAALQDLADDYPNRPVLYFSVRRAPPAAPPGADQQGGAGGAAQLR
jgi:hypothetical protein